MTKEQFSPGKSISRAEFITALEAMDINEETIKRLNTPPIGENDTPDVTEALKCFRNAGATPENRSALAKAMSDAGVPGCSYADLTNWVIRADLMRVEGIDKDEALALAKAGIVGVQDLISVLSDAKHKKELNKKLEKPRFEKLFKESLRRKCEAAAKDRDVVPIITDTQVVMVVKGAGNQKRNDTLRTFLNGFWPAIERINPNAERRDRYDVFPEGYSPSPLDDKPDPLVTEITSGERRIWVRETFWEVAITPLKPLEALMDEWTMATYTLGYFVYKLLFLYDTRIKSGKLHQYIRSFWLMYFMLLLPGLLFLFDGKFPWPDPSGVGTSNTLAWIGAAAVLSLFAAIRPARRMADNILNYKKWQSRWPSIEGWVLWILIAGVFIEFKAYILFLLGLLALELAMLISRAMAWPFRSLKISDTASNQYFTYYDKDEEKNKAVKRTGKTERRDMKISQILYRYLAVMSLPVAFLLLYLTNLLERLDIFGLGDIAKKVGEIVNRALSGVLGDVVSFAMHPEQAQNVRTLVANELRHFNERDDVHGIHIFSHSNGTPITYDTLFNHIEEEEWGKLTTYVTIGSVLNYMAQSNQVLQESFFPKDRRFKGVYPNPDLISENFKWLNFWNLVDPITEFYGLDDYVYMSNTCVIEFDDRGDRVELTRVKYPDDPEEYDQFMKNFKRHPASPNNIKTKAILLKNHSEYWSNIPEVHTPFAKRVLGWMKPPEWKPDPVVRDWTEEKLDCLTEWVEKKHIHNRTARWAKILFRVYDKIFKPIGGFVFRIYQSLRRGFFNLTKRFFDTKFYWSDFKISFHSFFVYTMWFLIIDAFLLGWWFTGQFGGDIVAAFSPLMDMVLYPFLSFWDENMNPVIQKFTALFFPPSDEPSVWQFLKDAYDTIIAFANDPTVDSLRKNVTILLLVIVAFLQIGFGVTYKSPYGERKGKEARPSAKRVK